MGEAYPQDADDTEEVFVDELEPGTSLMHGQYRIESFLNAGGFGITYNARDSLDRRVVIKECFPGAFCRRSRLMVNARSRAHQSELESIVRLFVQEARSLAKLDHPNIVGVHNVFEENNTAYMALDFVEGRDLLDVIEAEQPSLTPDDVVKVLRALLDAVGFVHAEGLLHRDISPDNILIDTNMHPVLIDFGAAREQATKQTRVLSALRVVKDGYSPQEFYIQGSDQGPNSDLYALAASFYHLISGEVPANSQARLAAIAAGQDDPYKPLRGTIPELDDAFLAALDKAMQVLPKDRLQSADEWLAMIDGRLDPLAAAVARTVKIANTPEQKGLPQVRVQPAPEVPEPKRRSKAGLMYAGTAILALLGGAFLASSLSFTERAEGADATPTTGSMTEAEDTGAFLPPQRVEVTAVEYVFDRDGASSGTWAQSSSPWVPVDLPALLHDRANAPVIMGPVDAPQELSSARVSNETIPLPPEAEAVEIAAPIDAVARLRPQVRPMSEAKASGGAEQSRMAAYTVAPGASMLQDGPDIAAISPAVLVPPQITPEMPTEGLVPATLDGRSGGPDLPMSETVPALPEDPIATLGLPPVQLPVFAIAPEGFDSQSISGIVYSVPRVVLPDESLLTAGPNEVRLYSVNGIDLDGSTSLHEIIDAGYNLGALAEVTIMAETGVVGRDTRQTSRWTLPVAQETRLHNGVTFWTTWQDDRWQTHVVVVPEDGSGSLQVGDLILSFVPTTERLDGREAIANLIEREAMSGTSNYSFAVRREGVIWVASMTYETALTETRN